MNEVTKSSEEVRYLGDMLEPETPVHPRDERRAARERRNAEMRTAQKRRKRIADASRRANRKK